MQEASDCDMVLAHDDDLVKIDGLGHDSVSVFFCVAVTLSSLCRQPLETLEPNVMMDLLRRSNIEIYKVPCGEPPTLKELRLYSSREFPRPKCLQLIVAQTPILSR